MLIKPRPQQKRVLGTYRILLIESLICINIIRRRFVHSYSQNFWTAEISSYTVYIVETGLLAHEVNSRARYAYIRESAYTIMFEPHPVTGCLCEEV